MKAEWVCVLLGSNIDKEQNLPAAVRLLNAICPLAAISPVYETQPIGLLDQANFLNTAVLFRSELAPAIIKNRQLVAVEKALKRVRTVDKNAPRTIDVDIILYGQAVGTYDGRPLPDPDLRAFPHVAVPVADLLPDWLHPETGEPLKTLAAKLMAEATAANNGQPPLWRRDDVDLSLE